MNKLKEFYCKHIYKPHKVSFVCTFNIRNRYNEAELPYELKTYGFYKKEKDAINIVLTNATDIYEYYYRYAVVETVYEGLYPTIAEGGIHQIFYEWNIDEKCWVEIDNPLSIKMQNHHSYKFAF